MSVRHFLPGQLQDAGRTESYDSGTKQILREMWCELIGRVEPCYIVNELFQLRVLSHAEMEHIRSSRTQKERAETLMATMMRRSQCDCFTFASLLCEKEGLQDLGRKLLGHLKGRVNPADISETQVIAELRAELSGAHHEIQQLRTRLHKMETRRQPEIVVPRLTITSSQLPDVPNIGRTTNCVTVLDDGTMFMSYWAGSRLNVLKPGSTDWSVHDLKRPIWNVFSSQNTCYIRASWNNTIFRLDDSQWSTVANFPSRLVSPISAGYASLHANDQFIHRLGGYKGQPLSTATRYDMKRQQWETLPEMPFTSSWCSSALIDNVLYVGGGYHENRPPTSVAALSLNESKWRMLPPMEHGSATISKFAGHLAATGGYTSLRGTQGAVDTVSLFEPKAGRWMALSPMAEKHVGHGVCLTPNGGLAVMGGSVSRNAEILRLC